MLICMRTTLNLDDIADSSGQADGPSERGVTLTKVIEDALRAELTLAPSVS